MKLIIVVLLCLISSCEKPKFLVKSKISEECSKIAEIHRCDENGYCRVKLENGLTPVFYLPIKGVTMCRHQKLYEDGRVRHYSWREIL
jgi:hypothetical protein